MPDIDTGLYKVVLQQSRAGVQMNNIFWYTQSLGANDAAEELWTAFQDEVLPTIADMMVTTHLFDLLIVKAIFSDEAEYSAAPDPDAGTITASSDLASTYTCSSVRLLRTYTDTRSGWKRFGGLQEIDLIGNYLSSGYLTLLQDTADVLATAIGAFNFFGPVLVRPPGTYASGVQEGWKYNPISSTVAVNRVTTQNSRKFF